jgi:hypothetical protein
MNKEFVPYKESLELKELGFDEPCFGYYNDNNEFTFFADVRSCNTNTEFGFFPTAPTFSQTFRFFREKHNLKSWVQEHATNTFIYEIRPHKRTHYKEGEIYVYKEYEKTELACLNKLIAIVKNASPTN